MVPYAMDGNQSLRRPLSTNNYPRKTMTNATATRLQEIKNSLGKLIAEAYADDLWEQFQSAIQYLQEEEEMTEEDAEIIRSQYEGGKVSLNLSYTNNEEQK